MSSKHIPDQEAVLQYFKDFNNWSRWGKEDQLGTLNLITTPKIQQAAGLVQEGLNVTCARPIVAERAPDVDLPPLHFMVSSGEEFANENTFPDGRLQASADFIGMVFHGSTITHVDSLAHFFWNGQMYNGRSSNLVTTRQGAKVGSIELLKHGVVSRGILLDVARARNVPWLEPGEAVYAEDLNLAEKMSNVRVTSGDILLVRTGNYRRRMEQGPWDQSVSRPGPHANCLPWFYEKEIAMLGSDTPNDVVPSGYDKLARPVHQIGIVAMGLWLIDNCNLEELADLCTKLNRWEFFISIGPLAIRNATGSPVNPIALF